MIIIVVISSKMLLTKYNNVFASTGHYIISAVSVTHHFYRVVVHRTQNSVNHACNSTVKRQAVLSGVVLFFF